MGDAFDVIGKIIVDASGAAAIEGLNSTLDKTAGKTSALSSITQGLGSVFKYVWANIITSAIQTAWRALIDFGKSVIEQGEQGQLAQAQLAAAIKSTGGVAGVTAQMVNDLAEKYSKLTMYQDDAVVSADNILLTFTNIGKNVFPDATAAVLDLATGMHEDLQAAAVQIGKALNDPIQGVTALRRVGVQLSDAQQQQVKDFMAVNDVASAQAIILKELQKEFGGSAEAAGQTFAGKVAILNNKLDNAKEKIFNLLIQSPLLNMAFDLAGKAVDAFNQALDDLTAGKSLATVFGDLGIPLNMALRIEAIVKTIQRMWEAMAKGDMKSVFGQLGNLWKDITSDLGTAIKNIDWKDLAKNFENWVKGIDWAQLGKDFADGVANIMNPVVDALSQVDWGLLFASVSYAFVEFIAGIVGTNLETIKAQWSYDFKMLGPVITYEFGLFKKNVAAGWEIVKNTSIEKIHEFAANVAAGWAIIVGAARSKVNEMKTSIINGFEAIKTSIQNTVNEWKATIIARLNEIKSAFTNKINEWKTAISSKVGDFIKAGKALIDGLIQGIESGLSGVLNAVLSIAQAAVSTLTTALQMGSPSKVFHKIGEFMMAGLANGIGKGVDMPINAILRGVPRFQDAAMGGTGGSGASFYHGGSTTNNRSQHFGAINNFYISRKEDPGDVMMALRSA